MELRDRDQHHTVAELFVHLELVAPEILKRCRGLRRAAFHRERTADIFRSIGKLREHMHAELLCDLARDLCRDIRVAIAVRPNPGAQTEEGWADRHHGAGLASKFPIIEAAVDLRDHLEERRIEDIDDGVSLFDRRRLLRSDGRRAEERVNLLEHAALVLRKLRAAQRWPLCKKVCDAADLCGHSLAACLGRVRCEDRVELKTVQEGVCLVLADLFDQAVVGNCDLVHGVFGRVRRHDTLAAAERAHTVVFLSDIREMEIRREGTRQILLLLERQLVNEAHSLRIGFVLVRLRDVFVICMDHVLEQKIEAAAELGIVLLEDTPRQTQEQLHVVTELLGNADLGQGGSGSSTLIRSVPLCLRFPMGIKLGHVLPPT